MDRYIRERERERERKVEMQTTMQIGKARKTMVQRLKKDVEKRRTRCEKRSNSSGT